MKTEQMDLKALPEGDLVLHSPERLTMEQSEQVARYFRTQLPGRKVLVIDGGATLSTIGQTAQLQRIEEKLDALLKALAAEPEEEESVLSLDGRRFHAREEGRSLG